MTIDAMTLGTVIAAFVAALAGVGKSYHDGALAGALERRTDANDAHEATPQIQEQVVGIAQDVAHTRRKIDEVEAKVDDVDEKVVDVDERVDDVARSMTVIHSDDSAVDDEALADRLDVDELDQDLVE